MNDSTNTAATLTREQALAKAKAVLAAQSTPNLIVGLNTAGLMYDAAIAEAQRTKNFEVAHATNLTRVWIIDELERRHPDAAAKVLEAIAAIPDDETLDYDATLIAAIQN